MFYVEIDFNSNEAIYVQLHNQIICMIADGSIKDGDSLPSVRQLADALGINMHTVNKAYAILREEGYIQLDRRSGAVVRISEEKERILSELAESLKILIAKGMCKNVTRDEFHQMVDRIYDLYSQYL